MQVVQLFFDHFWETVLFLFFFGGSIWAAIEWIIRRSLKHREKMQALKNEELRLQLQIAQLNQESFLKEPFHASAPMPKEASWEEQGHTAYETGYQQHSS
jgi:hypothetical protein